MSTAALPESTKATTLTVKHIENIFDPGQKRCEQDLRLGAARRGAGAAAAGSRARLTAPATSRSSFTAAVSVAVGSEGAEADDFAVGDRVSSGVVGDGVEERFYFGTE